MTDPRSSDRRHNAPERRHAHQESFSFPHDSCEEDCPVAIRNHERIETLFQRMDEERENREGSVKWKHFMWIVGGLFFIGMTINAVIWDSFQSTGDKMWKSIHDVEDRAYATINRLDVVMARFDSFITNHDIVYVEYREYRQSIDGKLDSIESAINTIRVEIGRIAPPHLENPPDEYPGKRR